MGSDEEKMCLPLSSAPEQTYRREIVLPRRPPSSFPFSLFSASGPRKNPESSPLPSFARLHGPLLARTPVSIFFPPCSSPLKYHRRSQGVVAIQGGGASLSRVWGVFNDVPGAKKEGGMCAQQGGGVVVESRTHDWERPRRGGGGKASIS